VNFTRRFGRAVFTWIVALLILFEEWGWEPLARMAARIARLPVLARLERLLTRLPPYAALAVFIVPALALLPVKLLAVYWISQGHRWFGVLVIVVAKLVGTAVVARLFQLTQPSLMRLGWFARVYARWGVWKAEVTATVHASAAWQELHRLRRVVNVRVRAQWRRWRGRAAD